MLWADERILTHNAELIKINIMQKHIDAAKVISSQVNFLPKKSSLNIFFAQNLFYLQQQRARATGGVYVHTDFDTKEKALSGAKAAEKGLK